MSIITYQADVSTLTINGRVFSDFVNGDVIQIERPNPYSSSTPSTDGGTSITKNSNGSITMVTLNLVKNSSDDKWINQQINEGVLLFEGTMQTPYAEDGTFKNTVWTFEGGNIETMAGDTVNNQEGNVANPYIINFRNGYRI